jgi:hypothetical protein
MKATPKVTFHGILPSPSLEADVRGRIADLEKVFGDIVSCRVAIEMPHRHHRHGGLYRVAVELVVPGDHLVAARSPDQEAAHADARVAIRDAFRAAHRQLEDYVRRRANASAVAV